MNVRNLTQALEYCGEVEGMRQTYYVFKGKQHFLLMSFSRSKPNAGYFNVVALEAVDYVAKRFGGEQAITARELSQRSRKPMYVSQPLDALNILYAMVATDKATIDRRFKTKDLHFNIK
jgi:hypothetical protein